MLANCWLTSDHRKKNYSLPHHWATNHLTTTVAQLLASQNPTQIGSKLEGSLFACLMLALPFSNGFQKLQTTSQQSVLLEQERKN